MPYEDLKDKVKFQVGIDSDGHIGKNYIKDAIGKCQDIDPKLPEKFW